MALLKKGSKKRDNEKKRKEVPTLGTFSDYKKSKGKSLYVVPEHAPLKKNAAPGDKPMN